MPKIIVGNVDNEHMMGSYEGTDASFRRVSSIVANRLIWMVEAGDILLLPASPSAFSLDYICERKGIDRQSITVISLAKDPNDPVLLTFNRISDPQLLARVMKAMGKGRNWVLYPYYFDRAMAWLHRALGIEDDASGNGFLMQGGAEILNSKTEFRRLAQGRGIPVPRGQMCSSEGHFTHVVNDLLNDTGTVMIKQDYNAGGDGNVTITRQDNLEMTPGSGKLYKLSPKESINAATGEIWNALTGDRNVDLTAEVFHNSKYIYYSDYDIPPDGKMPEYLNHGKMRMEPLWVGFNIPGPLPAGRTAQMISGSASLAEMVADLGYVGKVNFDIVYTDDDLPVFLEFNGRCGGTTHIHEAACLFLGADYMSTHTILTRNKVNVVSSVDLVKRMQATGLELTAQTSEGCAVMTDDTDRSGTIEYFVAAKTEERAQQIEGELTNLIATVEDIAA